MTWSELDWPALDRLRQKFLGGTAAAGPYWETPADLASYDFTYAERIGWKWDHVIRELRLRGWRPSSRAVFDWGCGSGIAARRVVAGFGADTFDSLTVWDHSPLACDFAEDRARRAFPSLRVAQATPGLLAADTPVGLLLLSHVLNELPAPALADLRALVARADAVLWVEPGTHAVSRQLGALRDELRATHRLVAPCTHAAACPVFTEGNARHWCHFFAPPPGEIFADSDWVKFGQRAGIDLRSLPYAFLAAEKLPAPAASPAAPDAPAVSPASPASTPSPATPGASSAASLPGAALSRVIGRVEHFKPYARLLSCDASGLAELELPKRADPALFKHLDRTRAPLVYRWRRDGDKLLGGTPLEPPPAAAPMLDDASSARPDPT